MRIGLTFGSPGVSRFLDPSGFGKFRLKDDEDKKQWLEMLIRCLNGEGVTDDPVYDESIDHSCTIPGLPSPPNLLHTIAYINIDNEINNHCAEGPLDWRLDGLPRNCYHYQKDDESPGKKYAEAATQWVYDFKKVMESLYTTDTLVLPSDFTPILLTVGMSTEVYEEDVYDGNRYFSDPELSASEFLTLYSIEIEDEEGVIRMESHSLLDIVDFASPHRYSPRAPMPDDPNNEDAVITIRDTIRKSTTQPILLEEYGAPTDPVREQAPAEWRDGDLSMTKVPRHCRSLRNIFSEECEDTAPGFIQRVINDLQRGGYAGYIAFMLTDALEDNQRGQDTDDDGIPDLPPINCSSLPPDIFTGLYAIGRGNPDNACGGTINNTRGRLKNTGYRVCDFYQEQECDVIETYKYLPIIWR
jgi:hypothetical protein